MQEILDPTQAPTIAPVTQRTQAIAASGGNVGAIAIEQERAIAEAQGQLILAKRFPRDLTTAHTELMQSCRIKALADVAFYSVPRGGSKVSGPSIRLAEEIARVYGNFEYGHRELSRSHDKSEVEVYAWDKEKNNRSVRQITVTHTRDTKDGQIPLRDQKDIDDKIANVASKQVRGRILALMPKWMVESAVQECRKTAAGQNDEPLEQRIRKMVDAFGKLGVKAAMLTDYLQKPVENATADDFADLLGVFNAIRDGAKIGEFFQATAPTLADAKPTAEPSLEQAAKGTTTRRAATKKDATTTAEVPPQVEPEAKAEEQQPPAPTIAEPPARQLPEPNPAAADAVADDENPFNFGDD